MDVTDIELGCLGLEKEGWFDPHSLLQILKRGATQKGALYLHGEVVDFTFEEPIDLVIEGVQKATQQVIKAAVVSIFTTRIRIINLNNAPLSMRGTLVRNACVD